MKPLLTIADLQELHRHAEDRTLEIKGQPIDTERLAQVIQAGANGVAPTFRIVIGATEGLGSFDIKGLKPVTYPFRLGGKGPGFESFDEYKQHVVQVVSAHTSYYFEGFFEIREIKVDGGSVIVIEVPQSPMRPHQNTISKKFYVRADGGVRPMDAYEIVDAVLPRHYRNPARHVPEPESAPPFIPSSNQVVFTAAGGLVPRVVISRFNDRTGEDRNVQVSGDAYLWIKLEPSMLSQQWDPTDLRDLIAARLGLVLPIYNNVGDLDYGRNDFGAAIWTVNRGDPSSTTSATQVTTVGEIWSIDTQLLASTVDGIGTDGKRFRCIYAGAVEEVLVEALPRFVSFATESLRLPMPLRGSVGLSGAKDFRLVIHGDFTARMASGGVSESFAINDFSKSASDLLGPFFHRLWKACGRTRPDKFRLDV